MGDIMFALSMCMATGYNHIVPYFYFPYLSAILIQRIYRDDSRCRGKYGKYWDEYCKKVPYKLLPYVF